MTKVKTTVKLDTELKKELERIALEEGNTLQDTMNDLLYKSLESAPMVVRERLKPRRLDPKMDNLSRGDYYD